MSRCYQCGVFGHFKSECPQLNKKGSFGANLKRCYDCNDMVNDLKVHRAVCTHSRKAKSTIQTSNQQENQVKQVQEESKVTIARRSKGSILLTISVKHSLAILSLLPFIEPETSNKKYTSFWSSFLPKGALFFFLDLFNLLLFFFFLIFFLDLFDLIFLLIRCLDG